MKARRVWIHSTNETPHCGTGRRLVIAQVGRRWARLRPASRPASRSDRVPVETYRRIVEGAAL